MSEFKNNLNTGLIWEPHEADMESKTEKIPETEVSGI